MRLMLPLAALVTGFLAGHGVGWAPDLLPLLACVVMFYGLLMLLEVVRFGQDTRTTIRRPKPAP